MIGATVSIVTAMYKLVDQTPGVSLGAGFYCHVAAVMAALSALGAAFKSAPPASAPTFNQGLCLLAAVSFLGVPAALLLARHGVSVWDIDDGLIKLGFVVWALLPTAVAVYAVLTRRAVGVAVSAGVALGLAGMVLFDLARDDSGAKNLLAGFEVRYPGLYNLVVVAALVLTVVLLLTGGATTASMPAAFSAVPAMPSAAPGQVPGAGWAPDPYGRHGQRYWDGHQWTAYVDDGGVSGTDPIAPPTTPAVPAPPAPAAPAAKVCPNGHVNPATGAFCTQCGLPLGPH